MQYPAHIRTDADGRPAAIQTVEEHCRNVACGAARLLAPLGLEKCGALLGYLHDMGKLTPEFKHYIERAARGELVARGSVNHTFAGVRFLFEEFHGAECLTQQDLACEVLGAALGAHHGWFDCIGPLGEDGFTHRLQKDLPFYGQAREEFLRSCLSREQVGALFKQAFAEISRCFDKIENAAADGEVEFYCAMLCRMLASALIDADRRDTAQFMAGTAPPAVEPVPWQALMERVEQKVQALPGGSDVNTARRAISDRCAAAAAGENGIHRLSVPTGGGKTLTALRYALRKTANGGQRRIFFVIPLLSVLEQNAKVLHDYIGDDRFILEHHSNLVQEQTDGGELDPAELLTEAWDAPVVITTLVQLLNTLFAGKTTCTRRMQALADSVIILDEVQTVPAKLLSQFNLAMNFLSKICGAEIVLCSATQPRLEALDHPILYAQPAELVPQADALWQPFHRTRMTDARQPGGCTLEDAAARAADILQKTDSLLIICNLKAEAKQLYELLKNSGAAVFHLSTALCMAHRRCTLEAINAALLQTKKDAAAPKVICVATQLVEAGVDFSFGSVIRILAGMDSAVQAAGRCNRNGEYRQECPVYLVELRGEKLGPLEEIRRTQNATKNLLETFARDSAAFGNDLASERAINFYYTDLFGTMRGKGIWDGPLPRLSTSLYELLSANGQFGAHCAEYGVHGINQAFKTAGEQFKVFEENTTDVLVPYKAGADCIADFSSQRAQYDMAFCAAVLQRAKPYTVSLYENQLRRLREGHGVYEGLGGKILMLAEGFYNDETGVQFGGNAGSFLEV